MEFVRYVVVFFVVGWGGGLIGGLLFLLTMPVLGGVRGTPVARAATAIENGLATLAAVVGAFYICTWTGENPTYAMYAVAFVAMMSNDSWRIKRAKYADTIGGIKLDDEPGLRAGVMNTERLNQVGDILGFGCGLAIVPPLSMV